MPVTPDLQPDEFELTFECKHQGCDIKTTFAYHKDARQYIGEVRKNARRLVEEAHINGRHGEDKDDSEITVCNTHETPLIWTFKFPGAEWFCMAGNHAGGMLGTGHKVEATPQLLGIQAEQRAIWDRVSPKIAIGRFWLRDCDKCTTVNDEYHLKHMTDKEKQASADALKKLEVYANGR